MGCFVILLHPEDGSAPSPHPTGTVLIASRSERCGLGVSARVLRALRIWLWIQRDTKDNKRPRRNLDIFTRKGASRHSLLLPLRQPQLAFFRQHLSIFTKQDIKHRTSLPIASLLIAFGLSTVSSSPRQDYSAAYQRRANLELAKLGLRGVTVLAASGDTGAGCWEVLRKPGWGWWKRITQAG